ncbi:hypothetical protein Agabi119p4_9246 [Agaricus bisporus var. burnettii]|uniref:Uncharacterized protein n=1 Tax=Agaricus bisporus var. burnettii TaxID=192524 RepID=A0A8H7EXT4_AGABI|nr:hypothetical protein Agabi119p4_9246 [Agaricus bisporus var. burnettii]
MLSRQLPVVLSSTANDTKARPVGKPFTLACPPMRASRGTIKNLPCILSIILCLMVKVNALTTNPNITEGVSVQLEISYTSLSYYVQAIFTLTVVITLPLFAIYSLVKSWSYLKAKISAILPYLGIASLLMGWRSFISTIHNNGAEEQQNEEDGINGNLIYSHK